MIENKKSVNIQKPIGIRKRSKRFQRSKIIKLFSTWPPGPMDIRHKSKRFSYARLNNKIKFN